MGGGWRVLRREVFDMFFAQAATEQNGNDFHLKEANASDFHLKVANTLNDLHLKMANTEPRLRT